jgi:hypothetical protein
MLLKMRIHPLRIFLALQPHTNNFSLQPGAPLLSFPGAALIRCAQFLCRSQQSSPCSVRATSSRQTARCYYRPTGCTECRAVTFLDRDKSRSLRHHLFSALNREKFSSLHGGILELCNMPCRTVFCDVMPCSLVDVIDVSEEWTACNIRTEE